jgi:transposase
VSAGRPNHHLFELKEATTMVVVGADVHKRTHTFVAVDEVGRVLGEKVVAATTAGHHKALLWARERFGAELLWGIEDCRPLSARLERDLLGAGQKVVRVAPKLIWPNRGLRHAHAASPIRLMRWRWRGRCCANPTCRWPVMTRCRGS